MINNDGWTTTQLTRRFGEHVEVVLADDDLTVIIDDHAPAFRGENFFLSREDYPSMNKRKAEELGMAVAALFDRMKELGVK